MKEAESEKNDRCSGKGRLAVAVLGASAKPARYSYQAVEMLNQKGYRVFPVHPVLAKVRELTVYKGLAEIPGPLDTITVYVSAERSTELCGEILQSRPRRVIFNPGAENPDLAQSLEQAGIEVLNACTLVMLKTGQFSVGRLRPAVRTCTECMPFFLRQASEAIALTGQDPQAREAIYREILRLLAAGDWEACPPLISAAIQRVIREHTGCVDPYEGMKRELNREALKMLPEVKKQIPPGMEPREAAVRLAIGGNILDAGAKSGLELAQALKALGGLFTQPLDGDWERIFNDAAAAGSILYLADNAGEIVFDRCLLEKLPPGKVTVGVRGGPVLNDATLEDAGAAGLDGLAEVISNGSDIAGTVLEECSSAFRAVYEKSDLIIAKGQGNYETLSAAAQPIYFLFQVKCPVIAKRVGASVGTLVVRGPER